MGLRWPPEDSDLPPSRGFYAAAAVELISDDDRSVAADSWSIRSEYGSTLDDEQRHVEAAELLSGSYFPSSASSLHACNFPASDYSSDEDGPDLNEIDAPLLRLQSYWDDYYAEGLSNFHEHGHPGESWFGNEVMDIVATWTRNLCANLSESQKAGDSSKRKSDSGSTCKALSSWSVLDIGTGNGLLLQELAKRGFSNLTGTDNSEGAIVLAQNLATRDGFPNINFLVDDVLETKLDRKFQLVTDKGTLDAICLLPDGLVKRTMYWESVSDLVVSGGILVITSSNNTKEELLQEVENFNQKRHSLQDLDREVSSEHVVFQYLDHFQYPRVCAVAFRRC